jgi:hypothetical protein
LEQKRKIYNLKKGDTLKSIADQMLVSIDSIKAYHNRHAHPNDRITDEFPIHLKEIFVSPSISLPYFDHENQLTPTVKYSSGFSLHLKKFTDKIYYTVAYNIIAGDTVEHTISFELSVQDQEQDQEENHLFEIDKISTTYINGEEPNTIADELAEKVASALYPIAIVVNKNGKWIDIYNYTSIKERFENNKINILNEYQGEWAEKYLSLCEQSLVDKDALKRSWEGNWFLNSFFNELYVSYSANLSFEKNIHFPLLPNIKPVDYKVTQKIGQYINEFGLIEVTQKGILVDERSAADFENEQSYPYYALLNKSEPKAIGNFESHYYINPKNNCIESLMLHCSLELTIPKKLIIILSKKEEEQDVENELNQKKENDIKKEMVLQDY